MLRKLTLVLLCLCLLPWPRVCALTAQSAVLIDGHTGRVLMEQNAYQRRGMASTTKIMTALVAIEQGNLSDVVTVSYNAANVEGSSMWLKSGEKISLESLLYGLMLNSGNDAATAIAEHVGGSIDGFADLMNQKARQLGLKDTSFRNPHGLDHEEHYTTAYDLAQLARYALQNETFAQIVATKSKTVEMEGSQWGRQLKNHNKMLTLYNDADGVKTGFTKKSGRCLVSSATRDGLKLIAVTLNASGDWQDHTEMLNFGFSKYACYGALKTGDYVKTVQLKNGTADTVSVYAAGNLDVALTQEEQERVQVVYQLPDAVEAPVLPGQALGTVELRLGDKPLASATAVAKFGVERKVTVLYRDKLLYLVLELLSNFARCV